MRKKINKADELYIKENVDKSAEEISGEIDLEPTVIALFLKNLKKTNVNSTVKRSRLKANGQNVGSYLTKEISDYVPPVKEKKSQPHIFKSTKKD